MLNFTVGAIIFETLSLDESLVRLKMLMVYSKKSRIM